MSQTSLLQGRPSFNQCSTGKLHLTAISRETDQNITPRAHAALPPNVSAILVNGDHSTPRSNINNTVSPYESLHMLRQGAQTTRISSEGFQQHQKLALMQIRAQKTLKKVRKLLKSQMSFQNETDEILQETRPYIRNPPLSLSTSSLASKQINKSEDAVTGSSNRVGNKRTEIMLFCDNQNNGYQTLKLDGGPERKVFH